MLVVVALGGNALLKRGEPMSAEVQRANVKIAAETLAPVARQHKLVLSHGNGPQVGLLALQQDAYKAVDPYPLDVLGAQTQGMIGYMVEQELGNLLPFDVPFATLLTMIEVDPEDPAFADPTKFIGPVYEEADAKRLAAEKGWTIKQDGPKWRRVVPSPLPKRIFEIRPIKWLLEKGVVVICAGGGGIPTMYDPKRERLLMGIEAVIDKDRATSLLAKQIDADLYVMATDADGVYLDSGSQPQGGWERRRRVNCASMPLPPARWAPRWMQPSISSNPPASAPPSASWPTLRRSSPARPARLLNPTRAELF